MFGEKTVRFDEFYWKMMAFVPSELVCYLKDELSMMNTEDDILKIKKTLESRGLTSSCAEKLIAVV